MLLQADTAARHADFKNLIRECERASRDNRRTRNARNRLYFLTGSNSATPARFNRLLKYAKDSASILYSPSFARFDIVNPPEYGDHFVEEEEAARDVLHRLWQDSEAALTAAMLVEAAHWQDTAIAKVFTDRNEPTIEMIADPSDVCVMRESINSWDRQEVIVHFYVADLSTFARMIGRFPEARQKELLDMAEQHAEPGADTGRAGLTTAQSRILLLSATPSMQGNAQDFSDTAMAIPQEVEPLVRLAEAWIWDDHAHPSCKVCGKSQGVTLHEYGRLSGLKGIHQFEPGSGHEGEYRVVTELVATDDILWEPHNTLNPGKHPFHGLCLNATPGYLWGICPMEPLIPLVQWREERMEQIRQGLTKQFDPAMTLTGFQGISEERAERLKSAGGIVMTAMPGGKAEPFLVPIPPDAFAEIEHIDKMIDEVGGLPGRVQGQSDSAVRSGDQLMSGATLGAGPSLSRAMVVEAWINDIATDMLRLERRVRKAPVRKANGEEFLLAQMPGDMVAVISAHSASPIYQQQLMPKIAFAAQQKWIDGEEGIELLQLPGTEKLRAKARKMGQAQAEKGERVMKAKEAEMTAKAHKAEADARKL